MTNLPDVLLYLLTAAFSQNLVLTLGLGSSLVLRMARQPKQVGVFALLLTAFSVFTIACFYPLDHWMGTGVTAKLFRPLVIVTISAVGYLLAEGVLRKFFSSVYEQVSVLLPYAAFNTVVMGISLLANHQFQAGFFACIGLALGTCAGFFAVLWLTVEAIDRLNHEDMPQAFRGNPSLFVYFGLLALALCGFASPVAFI